MNRPTIVFDQFMIVARRKEIEKHEIYRARGNGRKEGIQTYIESTHVFTVEDGMADN